MVRLCCAAAVLLLTSLSGYVVVGESELAEVTEATPSPTSAPTTPELPICDYSIVMPATVWLGSNVEVQVAIGERTGGGEAICQLEFFHGISGPRFGFRRWQSEPKEVTYQNLHTMSFAGSRKTFTIQTPSGAKPGQDALKLKVEGSCLLEDGTICRIKNSTNLHVEKPRSNIMIELDKPVYKPSQRIQGRVVAVDGRLRPINGQIPLLYITDASKARVAQWHNVSVASGIASFSLPLSSEPVLGDWTVFVKDFAGVASVEEVFKVDEYVLPKFSVEVEGPKCITEETSEICVDIDAQYTHGNPVKGDVEAIFEIAPRYRSSFTNVWATWNQIFSFGFKANYTYDHRYLRLAVESIRMTETNVKGTTKLCVNINEMRVEVTQTGSTWRRSTRVKPVTKIVPGSLAAPLLFGRGVPKIKVNFKETATGVVRNNSVTIQCQQSNPFSLVFVDDGRWSGKFRPGMPLKGMVKLSRADELPLPRLRDIEVSCDASDATTSSMYNIMIRSADADEMGRLAFKIDHVPCSTESISCTAKYDRYRTTTAWKNYRPLYSPSGTFLTLPEQPLALKVGKQARIPFCYVSCHEQEVVSINFAINARGHLVHSGSLSVGSGDMDPLARRCTNATATTTPPPPTTVTTQPEKETVPPSLGSGGWISFENITLEGNGQDVTVDVLKRRGFTSPVEPIEDIRKPGPEFPQPLPLLKPVEATCPCSCRSTCDLAVEFTVDSNMGPKGKLTVYTTLSSGEMVVDTVDFTTDSIFANKVGISFDSESYRPGQTAKINFSAAPGSKLAYSAVDKSLHLLGGENQITPDRASASLNLEGGYQPYLSDLRNCPNLGYGYSPFLLDKRRRRRSSYPYFFSASYLSDALDSWKDSNMVILTSNSLATRACPEHRFYPSYLYEPVADFDGIARQIAPPRAPALENDASGQPGPVPAAGTPEVRRKKKPVVISSKRTFFPETWLFKTLQMREDQGMENVTVKVPDTITSWSAAAYAVSAEAGLGVANPADITVFQPFFLSMKLPYSVIRGEILELPVSVFNYVPGCVQVSVELLTGHCYVNTGGAPVQELCLCTGDVDTVKFNISFNTIGDCPLVVSAKTGGLGVCEREGEEPANVVAVDRVTRKMKVEPGGVEMENVESRFEVKKAHDKPFTKCFEISAPEDIVAGSGRAWLSIVGDLLGPSMEGLESLLKLPYGCGEQNMLNFAPGVSITKYLIETGQLEKMQAVKEKAIQVLQTGYQRENKYRHVNGAYSAFGEASWKSKISSGCLWLTSFVVKSFCKAKSTGLVDVDTDLVCRSVDWIASRQERDGSFIDDGCLHHKAMMGGAQTTYSYTAYICLGLMELMDTGCNCNSERLMDAIGKCKAYLGNATSEQLATPYASAISCFGLTVGGSPKARAICNGLDKQRTGVCHWEQEKPVKPACSFRSFSCHRPQPSANVEITAYGLLANMRRGRDLGDSVCIAKWLAEQRNSYGGFRSTQDTVVALDALSILSSQTYRHDAKNTRPLKITYRYKPHDTNVFETDQHHIDQLNKLVVFKRELRPIPGQVCMRLRGAGSALLQVATRYNVREQVPDAAFRLQASVRHIKDTMYSLRVCTSWLRTDTNASNMALVTVKLPSGYIALPDELDALKKKGDVQLERWDIDGRQVFFYFEEITPAQLCFNMTMDQDSIVDKKQPTFVRVQDYYEPQHEATVEYSLADHPVCGQNFTYDTCDTTCGAVSCREHLSDMKSECRACVSGCRCKDNYVRLGDKCVLRSDCKKLLNVCPANQIFRECASPCPNTCDDIRNPVPRLCPSVCRRGCSCDVGYVLESKTSDNCVLKEDCMK